MFIVAMIGKCTYEISSAVPQKPLLLHSPCYAAFFTRFNSIQFFSSLLNFIYCCFSSIVTFFLFFTILPTLYINDQLP